MSRQSLSELLNGRNGISADMALRLEKAGWSTAESWLRNQLTYDLWHAKQRAGCLKVTKFSMPELKRKARRHCQPVNKDRRTLPTTLGFSRAARSRLECGKAPQNADHPAASVDASCSNIWSLVRRPIASASGIGFVSPKCFTVSFARPPSPLNRASSVAARRARRTIFASPNRAQLGAANMVVHIHEIVGIGEVLGGQNITDLFECSCFSGCCLGQIRGRHEGGRRDG